MEWSRIDFLPATKSHSSSQSRHCRGRNIDVDYRTTSPRWDASYAFSEIQIQSSSYNAFLHRFCYFTISKWGTVREHWEENFGHSNKSIYYESHQNVWANSSHQYSSSKAPWWTEYYCQEKKSYGARQTGGFEGLGPYNDSRIVWETKSGRRSHCKSQAFFEKEDKGKCPGGRSD